MELALALSDCGFHSEAVEHMTAVVDEAPHDANAITSLGFVLYEAGNYDKSLAASQRALDVDPSKLEAKLNLGHAYLAMGLPDDAEREYRRAIQDRKGGENLHENIRMLKTLISRKPDVVRAREMLQLLEEEQRKLDTPANDSSLPSY